MFLSSRSSWIKQLNYKWFETPWCWCDVITGLILGLHPANEGRGYKVTLSLISLVQALNQPSFSCQFCMILSCQWNVMCNHWWSDNLGIINICLMMTSSNGNIFCITGHSCREFNRHQSYFTCWSRSSAIRWALGQQWWPSLCYANMYVILVTGWPIIAIIFLQRLINVCWNIL